MSEALTWGIHGGRTGDADTLFLKKNVVAIGWAKMGDLSKLPADREIFKQRFAQALPRQEAGRRAHERRPDVPLRPRVEDR